MTCDAAWLDKLAAPAAEHAPAVVTATVEGRVGARVALESPHPPADWSRVLRRPEIADEWLPKALGVGRAELLAPGVVYQALDVALVGGLFHFRRQSVVSVDWLSDGDPVRTCWTAVDPAPWSPMIADWETGATWQPAGEAMGGWEVTGLPNGGSRASYQVWANDQTLVPGVQEWAMSRTLPEMMRSYSARVAALAAP